MYESNHNYCSLNQTALIQLKYMNDAAVYDTERRHFFSHTNVSRSRLNGNALVSISSGDLHWAKLVMG